MAGSGNIKGWFTINGAHVPILEGQSKGSAYSKFMEARDRKYSKVADKNKKDKKSMKSLEANEYYKYRKGILDKWNDLDAKKKLEIDELMKSDLDSETKWQKEVDIDSKYTKLQKEDSFMNIYDSKANKYMLLDNDNIFKNESKAYKSNDDHESKDINKLTPEQKQSLTNYTSQYGHGNYSDVNSYLYNPDQSMYGDSKLKSQEVVKNLDAAMSKCTLGQNCQVYRGIESSKLNNEKIAKVVDKFNKAAEKGNITGLDKNLKELEGLVGTTIENKGYMSTSTIMDPNYSKRGVTLVINAKSTDKAIHVESLSKYGGKQDKFMAAFSKGAVQHEDEILFDRNTNLVIRDIAVTKSGVQLLCDTTTGTSKSHEYKSKRKVNGEWVYEY